MLVVLSGCGSSDSSEAPAGPSPAQDDATAAEDASSDGGDDRDGATLDGATQDSALPDATPDANIDFAPWTLQVGAAVSFATAEAVATDREGNIVFTGAISGNLPFATTTDITTYEQNPFVLLAKFDNAGKRLFAIRASKHYESGYAIATDAASAIFVSGTAGPQASTLGDTDGFLRKYDANGTELWKKFFGSTAADLPHALATDASGNAIVVGLTDGTLPGQTSGGRADAFIKKFGPTGTELWTKQFGGATNESAYGVTTDAAGNAYLVGWGNTVVVNGATTSETDYFTFVRKFDATGTEVWKKEFGLDAIATGKAIAIDGAGNLFVVGDVFGAFTGLTSSGLTDVFVRKLDANGNEIWTKQFGTSGRDYGNGVAVDSTGNVFVGGTVENALPGQTHAGGGDGFVRKYSSAGVEVWTKQFGSSISDGVSAVAVDVGGNAYAAGTTYDTLPGATKAPGFNDGFVVKLPK